MTATTSYPPHPAEGRRFSLFGAPEAFGMPEPVVPNPVKAVPLPLVTSPGNLAPPDRRQHWLAYDPSSRSQYPVD